MAVDSSAIATPAMAKEGVLELRSGDFVMSEARAAAAYPNALSFSRSFVRKMQRESWKITTERLEIDEDGRGEGLYRINVGHWDFRVFLISDYFPPSQKIDRAFGINWDVSAAVCQGTWTSAREAALRTEIPKQYDGHYDEDVLGFCRGNRSERIFDHVVEQLAAGAQPDVALLSTVGYLLRSTAFVGNGLFGMKPFSALGESHPLGATYHAQMLLAYMLRHFVFDLVDGIASKRSSNAARLDRRVKRYLGVGNSAGLGLVPFIATHPQVVHQWTLNHEQALATAGARLAGEETASTARFFELLNKACRYFSEEPRDGNGIFADYERLAKELEAVRAEAQKLIVANSEPRRPWIDVLAAAMPQGAHLETVEIMNSILIELYEDVITAHEYFPEVEEQPAVRVDLTAAELLSAVKRNYDWLLTTPTPKASESHFWYIPYESPYEPRRGLRANGGRYTFETAMDLPLKLRALVALLSSCNPDRSVQELAISHPDLAAVMMRVISLDGLQYAELRADTLCQNFSPFAACRFLLAFYGMEKYDPRQPRSTKGALMQGAPLDDELSPDTTGDWPFPLRPNVGECTENVRDNTPLRLMEYPEISIKALIKGTPKQDAYSDQPTVRVFLPEIKKLFGRACSASGLTLNTYDNILSVIKACETCGLSGWQEVLDFLDVGHANIPKLIASTILDAEGLPAFATAPLAIDLAVVEMKRKGQGVVMVHQTVSSPLTFGALLNTAALDSIVAVADLDRDVVFLAGPGQAGSWVATFQGVHPAWARGDFRSRNDHPNDNSVSGVLRKILTRSTEEDARSPIGSMAVLCLPAGNWPQSDAECREIVSQHGGTDEVHFISSDDMAENASLFVRNGIVLSREIYERLKIASSRGLIPEEVEAGLSIPAN